MQIRDLSPAPADFKESQPPGESWLNGTLQSNLPLTNPSPESLSDAGTQP